MKRGSVFQLSQVVDIPTTAACHINKYLSFSTHMSENFKRTHERDIWQ
jgi:hypothetical protein